MRKSRILLSSIIVVLLLIALNIGAENKIYKASIDSDGVQRVEIVGGEYYFEPDHIIVKVNVPVELTHRKKPGFIPHNILIKAPEAGIDISMDMGKDPKTVTFTPTKTGKFAIYCDKRLLFFKSHRAKGMEGVLEVVE